MIEYIEFTNTDGNKVLIKKEAIRLVVDCGHTTKINDSIIVNEIYPHVKDKLREDPRRFIHDKEIDFRLSYLKSITLAQIIKSMPSEVAVNYVLDVVSATDYNQLREIVESEKYQDYFLGGHTP